MKFRKNLILKPDLQFSYDKNSEKHSDWLELLFDLIFVAAISQLALNLNGNYTLTVFLESIPIFFAIWWSWAGQTFYLSRFGTDDMFNRFLTMLQILVVAALTVDVKNALGSSGPGFAISYAFLRFILVAEYIRVGRHVPEARSLVKHYVVGFGAAAMIWLISAFVPTPLRFALWGFGLLVDFLTPLTAGKLQAELPLHPTHIPERLGLFTIILIGETIVSVVFAITTTGANFITGFAGFMGLLIAFSIWWGYFEESGGAEAHVQEAGTQVGKYQLWLYSHFPLLIGIVSAAVGIKHVMYTGWGNIMPAGEVWLFTASLGLALLSLTAIFISSYSLETCKKWELQIFRAPYYVIIGLVVLTGFLGSLFSGYMILGILTLLCIVKMILSFREPPTVCKMYK
ncbi:low temperature requirement protein A [Methanobacterium paludis]|uniref:Low temperature requirement A n=1 Tax=Methanobacterium paludis (strain DSM 25820 / JCM 18151 / SWAN1) TaxID=868131 RepID=F6D1S7_METPW|nr:low temperature requirement protein A [Methanobacterium paludis]AEG17880.1 low temperature requirement A [Methanobacterium paludis]